MLERESKLNVSERKFPFVSPNSIIREREGSSPGSRGRGVVVVHDNYAGGREGEGRAFVLTSRRVVLHKVLSRTFFPELMVLRLQFGDDRGESCLLSFRGYQGNRLRARNPHNPRHQPGSRRARTHRLLPRIFAIQRDLVAVSGDVFRSLRAPQKTKGQFLVRSKRWVGCGRNLSNRHLPHRHVEDPCAEWHEGGRGRFSRDVQPVRGAGVVVEKYVVGAGIVLDDCVLRTVHEAVVGWLGELNKARRRRDEDPQKMFFVGGGKESLSRSGTGSVLRTAERKRSREEYFFCREDEREADRDLFSRFLENNCSTAFFFHQDFFFAREAPPKNNMPAPLFKNVIFLGIDGLGGLYLEQASNVTSTVDPRIPRGQNFIPFLSSLPKVRSYRCRNVAPRISGPNWATHFTGMSTEEHTDFSITPCLSSPPPSHPPCYTIYYPRIVADPRQTEDLFPSRRENRTNYSQTGLPDPPGGRGLL